jgi:hypothetical protein
MQRSVITEDGFEGPAPKVFGQNNWNEHPVFRAIEWALQRAPSLAGYQQVGNSPFGPIRTVKLRPMGASLAIGVFFYEGSKGEAVLIDCFPEP